MAKAKDGTWEPGAGAKEPPGAGGVERLEGCRGNWRGPPRPRPCGGREAVLSITGEPREVAAGREAVGGGRSSGEGEDNTTFLERRAPASSMQTRVEKESG